MLFGDHGIEGRGVHLKPGGVGKWFDRLPLEGKDHVVIPLTEILDQLAVVFPVKDKIRIGRHFGEAGYRFKEKRILPITAITDV